jgi:hypothetical protein
MIPVDFLHWTTLPTATLEENRHQNSTKLETQIFNQTSTQVIYFSKQPVESV